MKFLTSIFTLFVAALLVASAGCGSDNSSTGSSDDDNRIVGTWNLVSLVVSFDGAELDVTTFDPCLLDTILVFQAGGAFQSSYAVNSGEENGTCITDTATGTWEFEGGNTYTIHAEGLGSGTRELTFFNNNNSFSFSDTDTFEGFEGEATITFDRQ